MRLPHKLRAELERVAKRNKSTLTATIIDRLSASLEPELFPQAYGLAKYLNSIVVEIYHAGKYEERRRDDLLEANNRYQQEARDARAALRGGFQDRVGLWADACFGNEIGLDPVERNHRFLEEALELVQACGCTASEAHQLVDYVFGRPVGEKLQEAGGAQGTLALLCRAHGIDLMVAAEAELTRCWGKIDKIRAKQAAKPKHGPLPGPSVGGGAQ